jgi:Ser/Thr protein kinase RdoA (MazF antagonist)
MTINPAVLAAYSLDPEDCKSEVLSSGLINATWKVTCKSKSYILQRINTQVFRKPEFIAENIDRIAKYLERFPEYAFVSPVMSAAGGSVVVSDDGHYRLFPFIEKTYTVDKVTSPDQAFEAAEQFGKFTYMLRDFDVSQLNITLPDFHNITLRYRQFLEAAEHENPKRIQQATQLIASLKKYSYIIDTYEQIRADKDFILRVTHHDTKISNVLYDEKDKGFCVIDLDTVMPGYFISDLGDMMRTYLSPVTEEETDFSKISVRADIYEAIIGGYLRHTKSMLTPREKQHIFYSGLFLVYMQALRFITDFLKDDVYYGAKYPDHNFNRGMNQFVLLERIVEKKKVFEEINGRYLV